MIFASEMMKTINFFKEYTKKETRVALALEDFNSRESFRVFFSTPVVLNRILSY